MRDACAAGAEVCSKKALQESVGSAGSEELKLMTEARMRMRRAPAGSRDQPEREEEELEDAAAAIKAEGFMAS